MSDEDAQNLAIDVSGDAVEALRKLVVREIRKRGGKFPAIGQTEEEADEVFHEIAMDLHLPLTNLFRAYL